MPAYSLAEGHLSSDCTETTWSNERRNACVTADRAGSCAVLLWRGSWTGGRTHGQDAAEAQQQPGQAAHALRVGRIAGDERLRRHRERLWHNCAAGGGLAPDSAESTSNLIIELG